MVKKTKKTTKTKKKEGKKEDDFLKDLPKDVQEKLKKIKVKVRRGFYSFYQDMPKKRYFPLFFLLNIVNWIVLYAMTFFIGVSLGIIISFIYFLAILPIATLISHVPVTIGGLGTREAAMIYLFNLFGVEATKIFSMSIISLFMGLIPSIIGIFLILKKR